MPPPLPLFDKIMFGAVVGSPFVWFFWQLFRREKKVVVHAAQKKA